jgi:hypothetical protein
VAQIKNRFDKETLKKLLKSALLLAGGYIAGDGGIRIIEIVNNTDLGKYKVPAVIVSTFIINAIREYMKGDPNVQSDNGVDTQTDSSVGS